jgi:hypothetical protein
MIWWCKARPSVGWWELQRPSPAHGTPVVSERRPTNKADLIVLAVAAAVRPGKTMRAELLKESREKLGRHGGIAPSCTLAWKVHAQLSARSGTVQIERLVLITPYHGRIKQWRKPECTQAHAEGHWQVSLPLGPESRVQCVGFRDAGSGAHDSGQQPW